jgi:hypothetical protein
MKLLRLIVVSLVVLFAASSARADDPQGVFDPTQTTSILGFNLIFQQGVDYDVSWTSCGIAKLINYNAFHDTTACLYFVNLTGAPIATFDFSFTDPGMAIPGPFSCRSADGELSNCTTSESGDVVTMDFSGGNPIPYTCPIPTVFILGLDPMGGNPITPQEANMDFGAVAGTPTYDPSTLILLASGFGLLGLCGRRRLA